MSRRFCLAALALVGLLVSGPVCPADDSRGQNQAKSKKTAFPIRESGYWTCEGPSPSAGCVYWLDNDRVIFNGAKPGDMEELPDGRRVSRHAIYIWDTRNNAVIKYADAARAVLCYSDGYIRYTRKEGDYDVILAGPFGKEQELSRRDDKARGSKQGEEFTYLNRFTCKAYKQSEVSPLPGVRLPLKEGHGFLYWGAMRSPEDHRKSILYFSAQYPEGITLAVERWQVGISNIKRSEFDDSYVMWGQPEYNRTDLCNPPGFERRIFRLTPKGTVSVISIPDDRRIRCGAYRFDLVRTGVLAYTGAGHVNNLDLSVLYLVRTGAVAEIARGVISDRSVSPDGCRVAVGISSSRDVHKPPTSTMYRGHLKTIELCEKENR